MRRRADGSCTHTRRRRARGHRRTHSGGRRHRRGSCSRTRSQCSGPRSGTHRRSPSASTYASAGRGRTCADGGRSGSNIPAARELSAAGGGRWGPDACGRNRGVGKPGAPADPRRADGPGFHGPRAAAVTTVAARPEARPAPPPTKPPLARTRGTCSGRTCSPRMRPAGTTSSRPVTRRHLMPSSLRITWPATPSRYPRNLLHQLPAEGVVLRGTYEFDARVTEFADDRAVVEDCGLDQIEVVSPDLRRGGRASRRRARRRRGRTDVEGGSWKVISLRTMGRSAADAATLAGYAAVGLAVTVSFLAIVAVPAGADDFGDRRATATTTATPQPVPPKRACPPSLPATAVATVVPTARGPMARPTTCATDPDCSPRWRSSAPCTTRMSSGRVNGSTCTAAANGSTSSSSPRSNRSIRRRSRGR